MLLFFLKKNYIRYQGLEMVNTVYFNMTRNSISAITNSSKATLHTSNRCTQRRQNNLHISRKKQVVICCHKHNWVTLGLHGFGCPVTRNAKLIFKLTIHIINSTKKHDSLLHITATYCPPNHFIHFTLMVDHTAQYYYYAVLCLK